MKRLGMGLNAAASVALAGALVFMVNYISHKHYIRRDMTRSQTSGLLEGTKHLLQTLDRDINMIVLASPMHDLYDDAVRLMREYELSSERIGVEIVHPGRDLARTRELALKHGIGDPNCVIIDSEGKTRILMLDDMAEFDSYQTTDLPRKLAAFRGEYALSSAIKSLVEAGDHVVYFLAGHGEGRIDNYDQHFGYSIIARSLQSENIEARTLLLGEHKAIPSDCGALVIAGPVKPLSLQEVEIMRSYLQSSGRLLLMVEAGVTTGLEDLLLDWGVRLSFDKVVGPTLTGRDLVVSDYGDHAVTRRLNNVRTIFNAPRSVEPAMSEPYDGKAADRPTVTALAICADDGWAEMTPGQNPALFDVGVDRQGPISVAVAVEKGGVKGMDVELKQTRIVVIGDAGMISNGSLLSGFDSGLFRGALNWLLDRNIAIDVAPERPLRPRVIMTLAQRLAAFRLIVIGMPGTVCLLGVMVWAARRK